MEEVEGGTLRSPTGMVTALVVAGMNVDFCDAFENREGHYSAQNFHSKLRTASLKTTQAKQSARDESVASLKIIQAKQRARDEYVSSLKITQAKQRSRDECVASLKITQATGCSAGKPAQRDLIARPAGPKALPWP